MYAMDKVVFILHICHEDELLCVFLHDTWLAFSKCLLTKFSLKHVKKIKSLDSFEQLTKTSNPSVNVLIYLLSDIHVLYNLQC